MNEAIKDALRWLLIAKAADSGLGKDIAKYIHKNNLCLEEYYIQKIENN